MRSKLSTKFHSARTEIQFRTEAFTVGEGSDGECYLIRFYGVRRRSFNTNPDSQSTPEVGDPSYPSPLDGRLEANKSKKGLERSQVPSSSPRLLSPKTATWPVWARDFATTRILLQNVKDICPHISVPRSWREHRASLLATRSKLATCHLVAGSLHVTLVQDVCYQK